MIFPSKHLKLSDSYIGLGSFVLNSLKSPRTVDQLWEAFAKVNNTNKYPANHTFDDFILTLDFLFCLGLISQTQKGMISRDSN